MWIASKFFRLGQNFLRLNLQLSTKMDPVSTTFTEIGQIFRNTKIM